MQLDLRRREVQKRRPCVSRRADNSKAPQKNLLKPPSCTTNLRKLQSPGRVEQKKRERPTPPLKPRRSSWGVIRPRRLAHSTSKISPRLVVRVLKVRPAIVSWRLQGSLPMLKIGLTRMTLRERVADSNKRQA